MIDIYSYYNYHKFLKDKYLEKKVSDKNFSFGYISKKLIISRSAAVKIFNGERHLPLDRVSQLAKMFDLNTHETEYLIQCISYAKSTNHLEKELYLQELIKLKPISQKHINKYNTNELTKWQHLAILSLFNYINPNIKTDLSQILSPPISTDEYFKAIHHLENIQQIKIIDEKIHKINNNIKLQYPNDQKSLNKLHFSLLENAIWAIQNQPKEECDFSSIIFDCPIEKIDILKEMIQNFRKELIQTINSLPNSNKVMQISIQLIPLSKSLET